MQQTEEHFFLISNDLIKTLKAREQVHYPVCSAYRQQLKLRVDLDLRELDCSIQPCRSSCPLSLLEAPEAATC